MLHPIISKLQLADLIDASSAHAEHRQRAADVYSLPYGLSGISLYGLVILVSTQLLHGKAPLTGRPLQCSRYKYTLCFASFILCLTAFLLHQWSLSASTALESWTIWAGILQLLYRLMPLSALWYGGRLRNIKNFLVWGEASCSYYDGPFNEKSHYDKPFDSVKMSAAALLYLGICISFTGLVATVELTPYAKQVGWFLIGAVPLGTIFIQICVAACMICIDGRKNFLDVVHHHGGWVPAIIDALASTFAMVFVGCIPIYVDGVIMGINNDPLGLPLEDAGWQQLVFKMYVGGALLPLFCA